MKVNHWGKLVARFMSVQAIVQILSLLIGVLLVRVLTQRQYAYYTIAYSMQGTMNVLADSGISIGLAAIGGKVWQNRQEFSSLISTSLWLRRYLAAASALVVTPILLWMLIANGASKVQAVLLLLAVLAGFNAQLTSGVLEVVPRMHSHVDRLQKMDLWPAALRLALLSGAYLTFLNASVAVFIGSMSLIARNHLLKHWVSEDIDSTARPSEHYRSEIMRIVRYQAPNAIFFCIQGQVTVWLISVFGNTQGIAEVGALGRLGVVFIIVGSVMANIVAPGFARCQSRDVLRRRYAQIVGIYCLCSALLFSLAALLPDQVLWLLGHGYSHLHRELLLMLFASIVRGLMDVVWTLNTSKGWIKHIWLYIPVTLLTQIILLRLINVSTVKGVIVFGIWSIVPFMLLNIIVSYYHTRAIENRTRKMNAPLEG